MKLTIDKNGNTLTLQAHVPHGPDAGRIAGLVLRSDNALFDYSLEGEYWSETETDVALIFSYRVQGLFACSGAQRWAHRLPRDIAFILEYDKRALAGDKQEIKRDTLAPYPVEYYYDGKRVADSKALDFAMMEPDSVHPLGAFTLSTSALRVTDPCYEKTSTSAGIVTALPGNWLADSVIGDTDWFRRVKVLRIRHDSMLVEVFDDLSVFAKVLTAGVDSGQCGFFDDACYPDGDPTVKPAASKPPVEVAAVPASMPDGVDSSTGRFLLDVPDDDDTTSDFYAECCRLTQDEMLPGGEISTTVAGVVSRSGFGDGGYSVKVLTNADGQVIAAYLEYLGEGNDEGAPGQGEGDD